MGEIAGYGIKGLLPDHDVPLLGTLAQDPELAVAIGYIVGVQADYFADSEAGGVDQLQKGAVPQSEGGGLEGGLYEGGSILRRQELGKLPVEFGEAESGHGVVSSQPSLTRNR